MKSKYEKPSLEIVSFTSEDIITTSGGCAGDCLEVCEGKCHNICDYDCASVTVAS